MSFLTFSVITVGCTDVKTGNCGYTKPTFVESLLQILRRCKPLNVEGQRLVKSVRADSHIFAKFAVAESSGLEAFRPRGKKQSSVPFIQTRHVSQLCWREYFWRRFRMHPYNSWLFYKDTKFSPDLLYYIIDNQIINLIFYAASPKRNQVSFDSDSRGRNRHLMAAWVCAKVMQVIFYILLRCSRGRGRRSYVCQG